MGFFTSLPNAIMLGIIWGIMAIGVYITYKILDFADLTVDGTMAVGGAICAMLVVNGVPVGVAIIIAFLGGALCGLVTGFFHTFLGIPPILSGILTQLVLWTTSLRIMKRSNMPFPSSKYNLLIVQSSALRTILILVAFSAVIIAILYWFFGTEFGSAIRATGCNINMSRAQGINTNLTKFVALALSNGIVAISGALLAQYLGGSDVNMGKGAIVIGLAAVVIGEAVVSKLSNNFAVRLLGVILGGIIYYIVYQLVIFLRINTDYLKMLSAIIVAIFLGVPYLKKKYFSKGGKKKNAGN